MSRRKDTKIELDLDYGLDIPRKFKGDPTAIRQVLTNLVANAIKFTKKGRVSVIVRLDEPDSMAGDREMRGIRINVIDTGIGIPEGIQKAIFESFTQADASTTREFGGTGLGLTISKALVDVMGGTIGVESKEGKGSDFFSPSNSKNVLLSRT